MKPVVHIIHSTSFSEGGNPHPLKVDFLHSVIKAMGEKGYECFEDGNYRGWLHPYSFHDALMDSLGSTSIEEIILSASESGKENYVAIPQLMLKLNQTSVIHDNVVIFSKNSSLLDFVYVYAAEPETLNNI